MSRGSRALRGIIGAALAVACSRPPDAQPHAAAPPSGPASAPAASAAGVGPGGEAAAVPAPDVDLQDFVPLLLDPRLEEVRAAAEGGRPAVAAAALERALPPGGPLSAAEAPAAHFLLGRLREQAGADVEAAAAYDESASADWALSPDATLAAARLTLRRGTTDGVAERLDAIPAGLTIDGAVARLRAELAERKGDSAEAAEQLSGLLGEPEPADWRDLALRLLTAQLALADKGADVTGLEPALHLARRVRVRSEGEAAERAAALEARIAASLRAAGRDDATSVTAADRLATLQGAFERRDEAAVVREAEAWSAELQNTPVWPVEACEAALLHAKTWEQRRSPGKAADVLTAAAPACVGVDLRARLHYLACKYAADDGRHAEAIRSCAVVEHEAPEHRLADDCRMKAALSWWRLGDEARFTAMLADMPDRYPEGDMVLDGLFQLALRRMERGDWTGAGAILEKGRRFAGPRDAGRGPDFAGRERYWRARAALESGETDAALTELEALARDLPLSYYMLQAVARLRAADAARADALLAALAAPVDAPPFTIAGSGRAWGPGFERALELLRVGDLAAARAEIQALHLSDERTEPALLWAVALLYARAGAPAESHRIARGLLADWVGHWPAHDWRLAWELAFPRPYLEVVTREAAGQGVPASLVYGVMREESAFDARAQSPAAAYGLMQIILPTAKIYGKKAGIAVSADALLEPRVNIALGARILADLRRQFAADPELAIPGYNAGPGRPRAWARDRAGVDFDLWVELIPFRETRRYTMRVLSSRAAYAALYGTPEDLRDALALPVRLSPR